MRREAALEALAPLGSFGKGIWGGDAIYLWARLPAGTPVAPTFGPGSCPVCPTPAFEAASCLVSL